MGLVAGLRGASWSHLGSGGLLESEPGVQPGTAGNSLITAVNKGRDNTGSGGGDLRLEMGRTVWGSSGKGDLNESSTSFSLPFWSLGGILFSVWGDMASRWFSLTSPNFWVSKDLQFSRLGLRIQSTLGIFPLLPEKPD